VGGIVGSNVQRRFGKVLLELGGNNGESQHSGIELDTDLLSSCYCDARCRHENGRLCCRLWGSRHSRAKVNCTATLFMEWLSLG